MELSISAADDLVSFAWIWLVLQNINNVFDRMMVSELGITFGPIGTPLRSSAKESKEIRRRKNN